MLFLTTGHPSPTTSSARARYHWSLEQQDQEPLSDIQRKQHFLSNKLAFGDLLHAKNGKIGEDADLLSLVTLAIGDCVAAACVDRSPCYPDIRRK